MSEQEQIMAGTNEATDAEAIIKESQDTDARTYTQQEFDDAMAKMKASVSKKALKPYEELGDPDTLRQLKTEHEKKQIELAQKRGEFDKIMSDLAQKKDAEIQKRDEIISEFRIEQPLLTVASEMRSVNPEQVKRLLKNQVRLGEEGEVEVLDDKGTARYRDDGQLMSVKDLVKEFLDANPHFVQSSPSTINSTHSVASKNSKFNLKDLDLTNPEHRRMYQDAKNKGLLQS
jgi:hypothetical protein